MATALAARQAARATAADTESAKTIAAFNLAQAQQAEKAAQLAFQGDPSAETSPPWRRVDARQDAALAYGVAVEADEDADAALLVARDAYADAVDDPAERAAAEDFAE